MDRETLDALNALQITEAAQRHPRSARGETQNLGSLIPIERLESTPPPDYHRIGAGVPIVICCCAPLVHVDIWCPRNEELELLFVELRSKCQKVYIRFNENPLQWRPDPSG